MRREILSFGFALSLAGCAAAQTTMPSMSPKPSMPSMSPMVPMVDMGKHSLTADTSVAQVLDALDQVGHGLKDFQAKVTMAEDDSVTGGGFKRLGNVSYQLVSDGNARVHVLFEKRIVGKRSQDQKIEYLLADGWLTDRNYDPDIKKEVRRQVIKPGQKVNLLKLGEGPFPLPIGQKREDVLATFDVKKIAADPGDPPKSVHLELTPKEGTSFKDKFKSIDVWADDQTHFPVRIQTLDKNEATTRTTDLSDVKVNAGLKDSDFELPALPGDWQSTQENYSN